MQHYLRHIAAIAALSGLGLFFSSTGLSAQVAVIAHRDVAETGLDKNDLMDLYTRDVRVWSDGTPIVLFDLKEKGDVRDTFYAYLGIRPSRMKSIWLKQLYAGEGQPPNAIDTQEAMVNRVGTTRGALGFVDSDHAENDQVKVLLLLPESDGDSGEG
jgi:ABC-type phosphate transport system substrate-binding protein